MSPLTIFVFFLAIVSLCSAKVGDRAICLKEAKMTSDEMAKVLPTDMRKKCFLHCRYVQRELISGNKYIGAHKPCEGVQDDNKCELGYKIFKCRSVKVTP